MTIGISIERKLRHTRNFHSNGYLRNDGLFDIEGRMIDTKSYDFPKSDGVILKKGMPLHEMFIKLTIDQEMKIHNIVAITESAPYKICKNANYKIETLIGESIGPGWRKKITLLIGGSDGCTHIRELLASMATVAFQTLYGERSKLRRDSKIKEKQDLYKNQSSKPVLLNSCYAYDEGSEVTKEQWPDYWKNNRIKN